MCRRAGASARGSAGAVVSGCLGEKVDHAAWHDKPSWFVVTTKDQMNPTDFQMKMAKQIGATTVNVDSSHVPMLSKPQEVAAAIISAASRQVAECACRIDSPPPSPFNTAVKTSPDI